MAAIKDINPQHTFWGLGGDRMMEEGLDPLFHVKDLSVTGFVEVIKHLSFFRDVMRKVVANCEQHRPDAAILLDYPGFNLRLGIRLKAMGIPVFYYISPQVWAWKKGRVKTMRTFIKRIFVIFPFEVDFYKEHRIPVTFTGHPVVEKKFNFPDKSDFFSQNQLDETKPMIALLPGSRRNEMERHTQPVLDTVRFIQKQHPDMQFVMAGLSSLSETYYDPFNDIEAITIIKDDPYPMIFHADVAIVASGTATLETAFLGTPLVVFYRLAPISYLIGKLLVHIDHLAMPNLIIGERAIPEMIQKDANGPDIGKQVLTILTDNAVRDQMISKLTKLKAALGKPGCANIVASQILKDLG
mgnify:CR=1 FL=1